MRFLKEFVLYFLQCLDLQRTLLKCRQLSVTSIKQNRTCYQGKMILKLFFFKSYVYKYNNTNTNYIFFEYQEINSFDSSTKERCLDTVTFIVAGVYFKVDILTFDFTLLLKTNCFSKLE